MSSDEPIDRELMQRAQAYLAGVVTRLAVVAGVRFNLVVLEGSVADTISRHATTVGADLLVMTTQGRGPLSRFWLGSVSDELVRQAGTPILFVAPHAASPDAVREPLFQRVLIPLDGSALSESILGPALTLGNRVQTQYTLLQVVIPVAELNYGPAGGEVTGFQESLKQLRELNEQESKRAHEYLESLAERLRASSFAVNTRIAWNERPATAILEDVSVHAADLIALATHGSGGLKRLLLGSVADKVVRGATTAVLVYRPGDELASPQS